MGDEATALKLSAANGNIDKDVQSLFARDSRLGIVRQDPIQGKWVVAG